MDFSMFENMRPCNNCIRYQERNSFDAKTDMSQDGCNISRFPENTPIAMSYTPMQQWGSVYSEAEALSVGTIFPELNLPFMPEGGCYGQR